ncbi:MAG: DUF3494 domain-containing protein [Opitutae bacterium]|nr:DUF3494 domain-containing protein [Opitutae bacterium]
MSFLPCRLSACLIAPLLLGVAAARAQFIDLGAAANFAGLEMGGSSFTYTISKVTTEITGNVGIGPNGNFDFSGGSVIDGTIYAGAGATLSISGGSGATGGIVQPSSLVTQAIADSHTAASYYAGLTPTQNLTSITGGTFTGNGGLNVYSVSGSLAIANTTLTLSGTASDTFVFNIYGGGNNLSRADIVLDGISASQVLFNLIGSGAQLTTTGHSNTQGIFLAENGAIDIQGGTHTSDFIAGSSLTWQSGVNITQATSAVQPVPEASAVAMSVGAVLLLGGLVLLREKRRQAA